MHARAPAKQQMIYKYYILLNSDDASVVDFNVFHIMDCHKTH